MSVTTLKRKLKRKSSSVIPFTCLQEIGFFRIISEIFFVNYSIIVYHWDAVNCSDTDGVTILY